MPSRRVNRSGRFELAELAKMAELAALAALAGIAAAACGGAPAPKARSQESQVAVPEPSASTFASPARWHYHPGAPEQAIAHLRFEGGGCVITAEGGQRWTVIPARSSTPGKRARPSAPAEASPPSCAGQAQAAGSLATEDLVGIIRRGPSEWVFVGESGVLYETGSPLAPFTQSVPAPEPLAKVAGSGSSMLAATLDGKLLRWGGAGGWQRVSSMTARIFDVAVVEGGRALALGLPEALFASSDGGATWAPSTRKTVGAHAVGVLPSGELAAQGITESVTWDPRRSPAFSSATE
ncbi:MAG TPA: hypothetical protein VK459_02715, partial [Polyangiaceae bacterium]|nr:hypothetical protein [Polyangiaceae bacterium]